MRTPVRSPFLCFLTAAVLAASACESGPQPSAEALSKIEVIGNSGAASDDEVAFLTGLLESGAVEERASAAWALGRVGRTEAVPALEACFGSDDEASVRANAVVGLATLGAPDASVARGLEDEEFVQLATLKAIADSQRVGLVDAVGAVLENGGEPLRPLATDVLGRLGSADGLPYLATAMRDPSKDVRTRAAFAMGRIADPDAVPLLLPLLADEEWELRANAVQALGMIGDPSARSAVEALADDPNSQVRAVVRQALAKL